MKPVSTDIPIHDIAPPLAIQEYSIYWFILILVVVCVIGFVLMKQLRKKKKFKEADTRSERYKCFTRIDVSDPKTAAYAMCEQGAFFARDSEEIFSTYQVLFKRLEAYKYAKRVEAIDEETLALYVSYQNMISA